MRIPKNTRLRRTLVQLSILLLATASSAQESPTGAAAPDSPQPARETRVTPTIRAHIFDRLAEAQTLIEEGDSTAALEALTRLAQVRDLNSYERANVLNARAIAHFDRDDFASASTAYEEILALPRAELPDGFIQTAMRNLVSTYWSLDRFDDALRVLDEWMALPTAVPVARDWFMKGALHYQLEDFPPGIDALEQAIRIENSNGGIGEENWYQILAAMYAELEQTDQAIATLSTMVRHWTKRSTMLQLAGQLSLAGRGGDALTLIEAAYEAGWLTTGNDLTTLANLYMNAGTPYKAARVVARGLADGRIEPSARSWMLLGQAWDRAWEQAEAAEAYAEASALSEDGRADARRATSLARLGRWEDCVAAASQAIERGELDDVGITSIQLGECLFHLQQFDEAAAAFERAERQERTREAARTWLAFNLSRRNTLDYYSEELRRQIEANEKAEAEAAARAAGGAGVAAGASAGADTDAARSAASPPD